jgi:hypothetical protein
LKKLITRDKKLCEPLIDVVESYEKIISCNYPNSKANRSYYKVEPLKVDIKLQTLIYIDYKFNLVYYKINKDRLKKLISRYNKMYEPFTGVASCERNFKM